ncbi:hypothetical protein JHW43_003321 [Diplocarpon mali]|nr:hypothetical protein JHW43_003321 [Diplocarpon mali]
MAVGGKAPAETDGEVKVPSSHATKPRRPPRFSSGLEFLARKAPRSGRGVWPSPLVGVEEEEQGRPGTTLPARPPSASSHCSSPQALESCALLDSPGALDLLQRTRKRPRVAALDRRSPPVQNLIRTVRWAGSQTGPPCRVSASSLCAAIVTREPLAMPAVPSSSRANLAVPLPRSCVEQLHQCLDAKSQAWASVRHAAEPSSTPRRRRTPPRNASPTFTSHTVVGRGGVSDTLQDINSEERRLKRNIGRAQKKVKASAHSRSGRLLPIVGDEGQKIGQRDSKTRPGPADQTRAEQRKGLLRRIKISSDLMRPMCSDRFEGLRRTKHNPAKGSAIRPKSIEQIAGFRSNGTADRPPLRVGGEAAQRIDLPVRACERGRSAPPSRRCSGIAGEETGGPEPGLEIVEVRGGSRVAVLPAPHQSSSTDTKPVGRAAGGDIVCSAAPHDAGHARSPWSQSTSHPREKSVPALCAARVESRFARLACSGRRDIPPSYAGLEYLAGPGCGARPWMRPAVAKVVAKDWPADERMAPGQKMVEMGADSSPAQLVSAPSSCVLSGLSQRRSDTASWYLVAGAPPSSLAIQGELTVAWPSPTSGHRIARRRSTTPAPSKRGGGVSLVGWRRCLNTGGGRLGGWVPCGLVALWPRAVRTDSEPAETLTAQDAREGTEFGESSSCVGLCVWQTVQPMIQPTHRDRVRQGPTGSALSTAMWGSPGRRRLAPENSTPAVIVKPND